MNHHDLLRRVALLEATLREMLRITDASETCGTCVPPSEALEGEHARQFRSIRRKARALLAAP